MTEPTRVLVVDDQELVRAGFVVILEATEGIAVVGEAGDGAAAVRQAIEHRPDVVLMDIRMPGMDGLEAAEADHGDDRSAEDRHAHHLRPR